MMTSLAFHLKDKASNDRDQVDSSNPSSELLLKKSAEADEVGDEPK